jgi:hypothetical protein
VTKIVFDQLPAVDSSHITDYNQVSWEAKPLSPGRNGCSPCPMGLRGVMGLAT